MAPNNTESDLKIENEMYKGKSDKSVKLKLLPRFIIFYIYYHIAAAYGLYLCFTSAKWTSILYTIIMYMASVLGVTAGAHRLWAHKSYKVNRPLEILLMIFHTMAFQKTIFLWARDHRLHHKASDTNADPYNAQRGFFFAHIGWLMIEKHPDVIEGLKHLELQDLYDNPVVMFQKKYGYRWMVLWAFIIPVIIPCYFWGETLNISFHLNIFRFIMSLHAVFCVNSVAHVYGNKPYDKNLKPGENSTISIVMLGEGFHNFHHAFPYDYRAAELKSVLYNFSTTFINAFAMIGWAYDLKTVSPEVLNKRMMRTGDGTDLWGNELSDLERKKMAERMPGSL